MAEEGGAPKEERKREVDEGRRTFLKTIAVSSMILASVDLLSILRVLGPAKLKIPKWPKLKICNVKDLKPKEPVKFNYPLTITPNLLIKLGKKVPGGVGPDGDIVAYSALCQHLGCIVEFLPEGKCDKYPDRDILYCPCHAGYYDADDKAKVLAGPPPYPLPQVILEVDENGDIYAVKMGPPVVYGVTPKGSKEVWRDLLLAPSKIVKSTG